MNVADGNELYHFVPNTQGFAANVGVAALEFSPSSHLLAAIEPESMLKLPLAFWRSAPTNVLSPLFSSAAKHPLLAMHRRNGHTNK